MKKGTAHSQNFGYKGTGGKAPGGGMPTGTEGGAKRGVSQNWTTSLGKRFVGVKKQGGNSGGTKSS